MTYGPINDIAPITPTTWFVARWLVFWQLQLFDSKLPRLTRFQASMRPPCFSKAILYYDAPLPSSGSARAAFPSIIGTIRALRLPVLTTELLMVFASPPQPILSEFAPVRWRTPHRPGPVVA